MTDLLITIAISMAVSFIAIYLMAKGDKDE